MRLLDLLADEAILLDRDCADWREAVVAAGDGLVASGVATTSYTDDMIDTVERLGPYIVISPGLALAHARPGPAVLRTGFSWVRPARPVEFGHAKNDPVRLVVGLAAVDHEAHQQALMELATMFGAKDALDALGGVADAAELKRAIARRQGEG